MEFRSLRTIGPRPADSRKQHQDIRVECPREESLVCPSLELPPVGSKPSSRTSKDKCAGTIPEQTRPECKRARLLRFRWIRFSAILRLHGRPVETGCAFISHVVFAPSHDLARVPAKLFQQPRHHLKVSLRQSTLDLNGTRRSKKQQHDL
jgi:hypothetical protein